MMEYFITDGGESIPTPVNPKTIYYLVEKLNDNCAFQSRDGIQLVTYESELRLLGGWNGNDIPLSKKEDWKSSDGITWIENPIPSWNLPRHTFICKVYQNKIWVMLNDVYSASDKSMYTFDSINGWISKGQLSIADNQTLYFHFLHTDVNNKEWIYFGGGQTGGAVDMWDTYNDYLHRWDGITLEKVCDFPIQMGHRSNSVAWSQNGKIYIAGGGEYHGNGAHTYRDDIWISEDDGITFSLYGTNSIFARQYANLEIWDNKIWYLSGSNGGNIQGLYFGTDPLNLQLVNGWGFIPARHASGICVHNNSLHIVAGNMHNDSFKVAKYLI